MKWRGHGRTSCAVRGAPQTRAARRGRRGRRDDHRRRQGWAPRAQRDGKALVAIAVEAREGGPRRVRMQRSPNATKDVLTDFVLDHVERGAEVRNDGWTSYNGVGEHRFSYVVTDTSGVRRSGARLDARGSACRQPAERLAGSGPTRAPSATTNSTTTSTSTPSASTAATHTIAACCSTACSSRPLRPIRTHSRRSTARSPKRQAPPDVGGAKRIAHFL